AAAKKVGAAPHRGNANRPLTNQAKAKIRKGQNAQNNSAEQAKPHLHPTTLPSSTAPISDLHEKTETTCVEQPQTPAQQAKPQIPAQVRATK
ncbi:MAG: hypothetical protein ACN6QU_25265, partial [Paraburkholderia terricola]